MSVYFVVQEKVTDQDGLDAYSKAAGPTLQGVRGRALAVDNAVTPVDFAGYVNAATRTRLEPHWLAVLEEH